MTLSRLGASASILTLALGLNSVPLSAQAACTVDGMMVMNPASNPMSGQTITCEGNLDNDGVVNSDANDVTVNIVAPSGGISVTGQAGVRLGDGATIDVASGSNRPINTSGDNAPGIDVGDGAMITVGGQVTTSGSNSGAVRTGDDAMVTVDGTVRTGGGMSDAINVGANSTVTVNDGGLVTTGNSNSNAVVLRGMGSTLNVNSGATLTTSSGMSNPVRVEGNSGTVNVSGDVRSSSGNSTAILVAGNDATITLGDGGFVTAQSSNSNAIEVTGTGAQITLERGSEVRISSGNSVGIVSGDMATVDIAGEVSASSSSSQAIVLGDGSTLNIMEMGVVSTSSSESQAVRIAEGASTATINVMSGGEIDAVGAQAVLDEGMTNTMVTVSGTVFGGSSEAVMALGGGDDMVTIESGGLIEGSSANPVIEFGMGSDTLTIQQADGLTGPGMLGDFGAGEDTLNVEAGDYTSSQFSNLETVNVGGGSGSGTAASALSMSALRSADMSQFFAPVRMSGGSASYTVDDNQSEQTINANSGGTVTVSDGGTAGTVNSDGGTTNVENGGSVMNSNASNGGSTNVSQGGTVMESRAGNGGSVNVSSGGDAGRVQSDMGGNVTVGDGGRGRVDSGSGNGGTINFQSGSTADMDAGASARTETMRVAGANFESGSRVNNRNSIFLSSTAAGDTVTTSLDANAFAAGVAGTGVTNANTLSAAAGLDRIAQAGTDDPTLDALGANIVLASANDVPALFNQIAREGDVQAAATSLVGAQGFNNMLRAGTQPIATFGPEGAGVWVGGAYQNVSVDGGARSDFDTSSYSAAVGVEAEFGLFGLDGTRAGVALGYTNSDLDSPAGDADVDAWNVGAYAGGSYGPGRFDTAVSYTRASIENASIDENADILNGRLELGFDVLGDANLGGNIQPFVRLAGTYGNFSSFEATGPVGTAFRDEDFSQGVAGIGLRLGESVIEAGAVRVSAEAAYEHVFGDRALGFDADLGTSTDAFRISHQVADKDRLAVGAQIGAVSLAGMGVALRYDGRYGSDVTDHTASLRVSKHF